MSDHRESRLEFYRRWHRLSKPYILWQLEQFLPCIGRRVADVGCGIGNFTEALADRDLYLGIDMDPLLLEELTRLFGHHSSVDTGVFDITSDSFVDEMTARKIDTILCVNVIEHIEDDFRAVRNMVAALPPGGRLCLFVPALPFLFGTLDVLDGHFRRYTKKSLLQRIEGLPVNLLDIRYFNILGIIPMFLKGRILKQKTHTDDNYNVMNMALPVVRPLEKFCSPPIGISLLSVFEKRS